MCVWGGHFEIASWIVQSAKIWLEIIIISRSIGIEDPIFINSYNSIIMEYPGAFLYPFKSSSLKGNRVILAGPDVVFIFQKTPFQAF